MISVAIAGDQRTGPALASATTKTIDRTLANMTHMLTFEKKQSEDQATEKRNHNSNQG
jgi:hypothetical protein